jgi:hypothetical protein
MSDTGLRPELRRLGQSPVVAVVAVAVMVAALGLAMDRWSYDIWAAFWVGPLLLAMTVPIARWMARTEDDAGIGRLILLAFVAKVVVGTIVRYAMVEGVYGSGDANRYSNAGRVLAPVFRDGIYENLGKISGTRFIEIVTGQVFAFIGPSDLGGYLVFSWLSFVGLVLLVRAFRIAVPGGDHRRYRLLVLFYPTLVFWPSSIGKDAWMLFCIGLAAYGLARVLTVRLLGLIPLGIGLWGAAIVRPHIALLIVVAGAAAVGVRAISPNRPLHGRLQRGRGVLVGVALVVGVVVVTGQAQEFLDIESLDPESAETVLTEVTRRTGQGGSEFEAPSPDSPGGYVASFVTVLFRPFPGEASGGTGLLTSAEGLVLIVLLATSFGRLARAPAMIRESPYVLTAVVYVLAFAYAFSSIENFGLLARQRAQMLPFLFVLVSLPRRSTTERVESSDHDQTAGAATPAAA